MSKNNVHPDHYKTAGRDRPDDAARARLARAIAAKAATREGSDRMTKGLYFERPEPARPVPAHDAADRAPKKASPRARAARKAARKKAAVPRRAVTARKAGPRQGSPARSAGRGVKKK